MLQVDELVPDHPVRRWADQQTRRQQGGVYDSAASVNSVEGRSLIIMAYASDCIVSGAVLHADPAEAENTAFSLTGEDARGGTWKHYDALCDPVGNVPRGMLVLSCNALLLLSLCTESGQRPRNRMATVQSSPCGRFSTPCTSTAPHAS